MAETDSGLDSSSTIAPTTDGPGSECTDGVVDEGEVCDDGNDIDGDGCNNDCQSSGSVVWQRALGGTGGTFRAVATHARWGVVAGGEVAGPAGADASFVRLTLDGEVEVQAAVFEGAQEDRIRALAIDDMGRLFAVGEFDAVGPQSTGWLAEINMQGEVANGPETIGDPGLNSIFAIELAPGTITVAGHRSDAPSFTSHAQEFTPTLTPGAQLETVEAEFGTSTESIARGVARDMHGVYVCGYRASAFGDIQGFTAASPVDEVALDAVEGRDAFTVGLAIAQPGDPTSSIFSVGWREATDVPWIARMHQVSRDGALINSMGNYLGHEDAGAFYLAIGVDNVGDLVVVGASGVADQDPEDQISVPLVRKFSLEGVERWTQVLTTDDAPFGGLNSLAFGDDNRIVVGGNVRDIADDTQRFVAVLRP